MMTNRLMFSARVIGAVALALSFISTLRPDVAPPAWRTQIRGDETTEASTPGAVLSPHARSGTESGVSAPLAMHGDVGVNIAQALNARNGALRFVTIPPGSTWSFNAAIGAPAGMELRSINGVLGGGWCDLASRYVQAARPLLPPDAFRYRRHRPALPDVSADDSVTIWNIDGRPGTFGGRFDLEITNSGDAPLIFAVEQAPDRADAIIVRAWFAR